jgi:DNA-binding response OmpR family regulator
LDLRGLRVLIVEDDCDLRSLHTATMRQYGAEAKDAASVAEAIDILLAFRPHVIISDLGMPVEDGFVLIRRIRELAPDQGGTTPAVAVTAYSGSSDRVRALAAGYQRYMSKPFDPEELVAVVASLVDQPCPSKAESSPR